MDKTIDDKNKEGLLQISKEIADLFLDDVWKENKDVRYAWHVFFICLLIMSFTLPVGRLAFAAVMRQSSLYTEIFRAYRFFIFVIILASLIWLGYQYYKNLLMTGRDLRFQSITFFVIIDILLFGLLYHSLYYWHPELFAYKSQALIPTATAMDVSAVTLISLFEFMLYTACTNISINYPNIASNSSIVSTINFVQVLVWLALMGLFIATFVQLAARRKK